MLDTSKIPYSRLGMPEYKTNCITKIPQDIKLEINEARNGIVLKAGSKVYYGDGSSEIIQSDLDSSLYATQADTVNDSFFVVTKNSENKQLRFFSMTETNSGNASSATGQWRLWYDTTTKTVKCSTDSGATWEECSLPVCTSISMGENLGFSSIKQIFNGFGYIGRMSYVVPGIEFIIPNGKNPDGTLINITTKTTELKSSNDENTTVMSQDGFLNINGKIESWGGRYFETESEPTIEGPIRWYDVKNNLMKTRFNNSTNWDISQIIYLGRLNIENSKQPVSEFTPKGVFQYVDRNEADYVIETFYTDTFWYRKYKSGWLEMGGTQSNAVSTNNGDGANGDNTLTFPHPFKTLNYTLTVNTSGGSSGWDFFNGIFVKSKNLNSAVVKLVAGVSSALEIIWRASGF